TEVFTHKVATGAGARGVCVLPPLGLQSLLGSTWREAIAAEFLFVPGQTITTGANPLATVRRYAATRRYQSVMGDYATSSVPLGVAHAIVDKRGNGIRAALPQCWGLVPRGGGGQWLAVGAFDLLLVVG
ncbi:receptor-type adenylate cyclase, partial [Trypanosoma rangeli]